jgi:hypothetical protein
MCFLASVLDISFYGGQYMKSNAPGQLLGYALQFPRALYHLLRSAPNDVVCIEVVGDVAIRYSNGDLLTEEDKSSVLGNVLTDRSKDLWKTISNWIEASNSGFIDIEKTQFVLYTNQSGRKGLVNEFNEAQDPLKAEIAYKKAKDTLKDLEAEHEIWKYYNYVVNENENQFMKIIQRFNLQIESEAGYDAVRIEIQKKHVSEKQIDFIMENLNGWVFKIVVESIAARRSAIITWEDFDKQFKVLFDRSRSRELIDFTMNYSKEHDKVKKQIKERPIYLKQLEAIELTENEMIEAISDFLRADANLERWIENETIDDDIALDFEERLTKFWKNQRKRIGITEKNLNAVEQGQLLLSECNSRLETIRDMTPPASTIPGTYHALADEAEIGWHSEWDKIFIKEKGD